MQCNIDARGRAVRLVFGTIVLLVGLVFGGLRALGILTPDWWWAVAGLVVAFGGFGVFEARAGWCVVRAMGFKTRI